MLLPRLIGGLRRSVWGSLEGFVTLGPYVSFIPVVSHRVSMNDVRIRSMGGCVAEHVDGHEGYTNNFN